MKSVGVVIISIGVPYLQMRSEGSYMTPGRAKEGKKEKTRKYRVGSDPPGLANN